MDESIWVDREHRDKVVLGTFLALFSVSVVTALIMELLGSHFSLYSALLRFFNYLTLVLFAMGIVSFPLHFRRSILTKLEVLCVALAVAAALALLLMVDGSIASYLVPEELIQIFDHEGVMISLALLSIAFLFLAGFGVIGVLSSMMRLWVPPILNAVQRVRYGESDGGLSKVSAYLFDVPYVLDASEVDVDLSEDEGRFPTGLMWKAALMDIGLALVIGIYFAFNPFLIEGSSATSALAMATSASLCVPMFIVPWSLLSRLRARVPNEGRDYMLADGLKGRITSLCIAAGTILAFVRIAMQNIGLAEMVTTYVSYVLINVLIGMLFMFIYFNYYERDLVRDVSIIFVIDNEKEFDI